MLAKEINLDFGQVYVLDAILISVIREGILFNAEKNQELINLGDELFKGQPYGLISNRKYSYAVDPLIYRQISKVENLKAIAIVTNSDMVKLSVSKVEQRFYKSSNSFEIFDDLDRAINWMQFEVK